MSKKIASNRRKDEKELESQINILEKRLSGVELYGDQS